jgi:hypothetical protein
MMHKLLRAVLASCNIQPQEILWLFNCKLIFSKIIIFFVDQKYLFFFRQMVSLSNKNFDDEKRWREWQKAFCSLDLCYKEIDELESSLPWFKPRHLADCASKISSLLKHWHLICFRFLRRHDDQSISKTSSSSKFKR